MLPEVVRHTQNKLKFSLSDVKIEMTDVLLLKRKCICSCMALNNDTVLGWEGKGVVWCFGSCLFLWGNVNKYQVCLKIESAVQMLFEHALMWWERVTKSNEMSV